MNVISFSELRQNMREVMNTVVDQHDPMIVTRQKEAPLVLMSLSDYNAIEETAYILSNPHNAEEILTAVARVRKGLAKPRELINP